MWSEWVSREGSIRAFTTNPQYKQYRCYDPKECEKPDCCRPPWGLGESEVLREVAFRALPKGLPFVGDRLPLGGKCSPTSGYCTPQGFDPWMGAVLVPVGVPDMAPGATGTCGVLESLEFREIVDPKGPRSGIHAFPLLQPSRGACALYVPPLLVCLGLRSISRFAPLGVPSTVGLRT